MDSRVTTFLSFLVVWLAAVGLQILFYSPISPAPLELSYAPTSFPPNTHLQKVMKLGEGLLKNPEDVSVDKEGILYTTSRDGWIKRMHRNGTWENWKNLKSTTLLGSTFTTANDFIICDADKGLLKVDEDGVTVLASHFNGTKIGFADDVVEASDGSLYFSVASTKFGFHDWFLDVLEAKPHGQLLKYDPSSNQTTLLLDNLGFANGVALSENQDYLVVCESWKFRCLKYWLKEEIKGKTEIFIDNLPGAPDNINLAPDGSFWIAILQLITRNLEFVHTSRVIKRVLATFPKLIEVDNGVYSRATVVNVGNDGKIIKMLDDPNGKVMSFVTSAVEFEDHLYLGNLNSDFIGKLPLKTA